MKDSAAIRPKPQDISKYILSVLTISTERIASDGSCFSKCSTGDGTCGGRSGVHHSRTNFSDISPEGGHATDDHISHGPRAFKAAWVDIFIEKQKATRIQSSSALPKQILQMKYMMRRGESEDRIVGRGGQGSFVKIQDAVFDLVANSGLRGSLASLCNGSRGQIIGMELSCDPSLDANSLKIRKAATKRQTKFGRLRKILLLEPSDGRYIWLARDSAVDEIEHSLML